MPFDEAMVERVATTALCAWYSSNQPIAPSAWRRIAEAVLTELSKTHAVVPLEEYEALQAIAKAAVCCRRTLQEVANSGWADTAIVANNDANTRFHRVVYAWMNTTWEVPVDVPHAH